MFLLSFRWCFSILSLVHLFWMLFLCLPVLYQSIFLIDVLIFLYIVCFIIFLVYWYNNIFISVFWVFLVLSVSLNMYRIMFSLFYLVISQFLNLFCLLRLLCYIEFSYCFFKFFHMYIVFQVYFFANFVFLLLQYYYGLKFFVIIIVSHLWIIAFCFFCSP